MAGQEAFYTPPRPAPPRMQALAVLADVTERNKMQMESVKAFVSTVSDLR